MVLRKYELKARTRKKREEARAPSRVHGVQVSRGSKRELDFVHRISHFQPFRSFYKRAKVKLMLQNVGWGGQQSYQVFVRFMDNNESTR